MIQKFKTPKEEGYQMPAEWEVHEATLLAWPHSRRHNFFGDKELFKGDISLNANAQFWDYPNKLLGNYDIVNDLGAAYSGKIDFRTTWRHLWGSNIHDSGDFYLFGISKNIPLKKIGKKEKGWILSFTPDMTAVYSDNFFLEGNDWNLRPTGTLSLSSPHDNFSFRVVGGYNVNLGDKETREIKENQPIFQVGFTYKF